MVFRAPDMHHAANILLSLGNLAGPCTLGALIVKSGVALLLSVYLLYWAVLELLKRQPHALKSLFNERFGFYAPIRAAAWTAAILLMVAAKPTEATPFVYFQF